MYGVSESRRAKIKPLKEQVLAFVLGRGTPVGAENYSGRCPDGKRRCKREKKEIVLGRLAHKKRGENWNWCIMSCLQRWLTRHTARDTKTAPSFGWSFRLYDLMRNPCGDDYQTTRSATRAKDPLTLSSFIHCARPCRKRNSQPRA